MRSDSTVVPPVTAERSPPDSRITGADSPVIADSSTEAMPSTTSPSPGMTWPASTTTMSPCCSSGAGDLFLGAGLRPASSRSAGGPWCRPWPCAGVSAWALPRPSATASARLAKSTVSHSQNTISQANQVGVHDRQHGRPHGADLDDEHHRVAPQGARIELAQRVRQRLQQHLRVEQAALHALALGAGARRAVGDAESIVG